MDFVSMVIKVKCGDKMRRFRALVIGGKLELTVRELKQKITSLFGLLATSEHLFLTYIDEDGDVMDLVDDEDLRDVVEQGLNPLRITVAHHSSGSSILRLLGTKLTVSKSIGKTAVSVSSGLKSSVWSASRDLMELLEYYKKWCFSFRPEGPKTQPEQGNHSVVPSKPSILHGSAGDKTTEYSRLSNLGSCLVEDVNIDITIEVAPSTPFKKTWRMRNTGRAEWPQKTQLIWIGGDRLSHQSSFEVKLPLAGLPVDKEVDIVVDLIAPVIPDDYIAFWRLESPSGERFGQRIKVIVKVEDPDEYVMTPMQLIPASLSFLTVSKKI